MAKFYKKTMTLDAKFEPMKEGSKPGDIYVEKIMSVSKQYGKESVTNEEYIIHSGNKTAQFSKRFFKEFKKQGKLDAKKIFDSLEKDNPGQDKIKLKPQFDIVKAICFLLAVIGLIGAPIFYFVTINEKNFSSETIVFESNDSVNVGDYIEGYVSFLDGIDIEVETVNSSYGIETSRNASKGNSYILSYVSPDEGVLETYILRYDSSTDLGKEIEIGVEAAVYNINLYYDTISAPSFDEATFDVNSLNYYPVNFPAVTGEVKELSSIEKLDDGTDILSSLNDSADYWGAEIPVYLIDARVTKGDITPVIIGTAVLAIIGIASVAGSIYFMRKSNQYIVEVVNGIDPKTTGSVIEK